MVTNILSSKDWPALSVRQPWAYLLAHGHKNIENRPRNSKHRGPFWIHASKTFDKEGYEFVRENFPEIQMPKPEDFRLGGIVGAAEIEGVVTNKKQGGAWFFGPYGYQITNATVFPFIQCKGMLGFFKPDLGREKGGEQA